MATIDCAGRPLDLSVPRVMGILNVTPDSFSDGGSYFDPATAIEHARQMVSEGADLIDVGGESTRPGADEVPEQQELDRVIPVIESLAAEFPQPVSVDTSKAVVMREAAAAGAGMINDVTALRGEGALAAAAHTGLPVCLMHMQGKPRTMQHQPHYADVIAEVGDYLQQRVGACRDAGIPGARLLLDPGFGFGKTLAHNLSILKNLRSLADMGLPLLVGISRKSMIGAILDGAPVDQRLFGSLSAAVLALEAGASIIRTHDVAATADVVKVFLAVRDAG